MTIPPPSLVNGDAVSLRSARRRRRRVVEMLLGRGTAARRWAARAGQAATLAFIALVVWLLLSRAARMDWSEVGAALGRYEPAALLAAAALALCGYAAAASYDLLGRRYVGHELPARRVLAINFIAYAFSLNLGALVGGWGFRVRLYARFRLVAHQISRIIALAVVTNWSGYVLVAAVLLLLAPPAFPPPWPLGPDGLRTVGGLLLLSVVAYLLLCTAGQRRGLRLQLRGVAVRAPSPRMALAQLALSSASWLLMAAAIHSLLPEAAFAKLLAVLFASSVVGAMTHIPGSLGVIEGSFVMLLAGDVEAPRVLAAVLAFRAVYYLLPLALAAIGYAALELAARRRLHAAEALD